MKTLIATFSISAALLAPAATLAATPVTSTAQTATSNTVAHVASPVASQETTNAAHVATSKQNGDKSFGLQASDDRQGLSRVQEQSRQLGATN